MDEFLLKLGNIKKGTIILPQVRNLFLQVDQEPRQESEPGSSHHCGVQPIHATDLKDTRCRWYLAALLLLLELGIALRDYGHCAHLKSTCWFLSHPVLPSYVSSSAEIST